MDLVRHEISLCCLETRSASWRGVGDIFSASCSTIKTSYIAIGSQKCAQHRDCSAGELCSKAGVHGEASAPPQPRRAISQVFLWSVSAAPLGLRKIPQHRPGHLHAFGWPIADFSCAGRGSGIVKMLRNLWGYDGAGASACRVFEIAPPNRETAPS